MARSTAQQRALLWILAIALILALAYIVYLFTSPTSPLRPQASEIVTTGAGGQPLYVRDGIVVSFDGTELVAREGETGTFSLTLSETSVVRQTNAEGLFEITDQSTLTEGDIVSVQYSNTDTGPFVNSVDILENK